MLFGKYKQRGVIFVENQEKRRFQSAKATIASKQCFFNSKGTMISYLNQPSDVDRVTKLLIFSRDSRNLIRFVNSMNRVLIVMPRALIPMSVD